jgi:hypothetical protein
MCNYNNGVHVNSGPTFYIAAEIKTNGQSRFWEKEEDKYWQSRLDEKM